MKRSTIIWRGILIFVAVLAGYTIVFAWIEHRRVFKGPWTVTFDATSDVPALVVSQQKLELHDVRITFPKERGATNVAQTVEFFKARAVPFDVPFGKCVFLDTTFLPGTVTFEMFGHEIQLLPRVLTIDKVEHPWRNGETFELRQATGRAK